MRFTYKPKHIDFLRKNIKGRTYKELWSLFNRRFRMKITYPALKRQLRNHKIKNNWYGRRLPRPIKYFDKHFRWLRENVPGVPYETALKKFNARFGFSISCLALRALCKKINVHNGFTGRFTEGHVSHNKGKKGYYSPGSEKGWFRPGHPGFKMNEMPVGSERVTADGYVEVKYSDRKGNPSRRWRSKSAAVWEAANGKIPKGHVVIFADGDRRNFALKNLTLVSRKELYVLNHLKKITRSGKTDETLVSLAKLRVLVADKKRDSFRGGRKLVVIDGAGNRRFVVKDGNFYFPVMETGEGARRFRRGPFRRRKTRAAAERDLKEYAMKRGWFRE